MTETKKILNSLACMAENLLQMLMGVVDSYLVAQVGIVAISGVSVANNNHDLPSHLHCSRAQVPVSLLEV